MTPSMTGANLTESVCKAYICQYAPDGYDDRIWDNDAKAGYAADDARRSLATSRL